jgi:DNA-binding XRE family transcriptional regulator
MKNSSYKIVNIDDELAGRHSTPESKAEYEAMRRALMFGVECCIRREELGYKQKDMAQFGIPAETMCRIEKGDRLPDTKTVPKLAAALQARIIVEPTGEWKLEPLAALQNAA